MEMITKDKPSLEKVVMELRKAELPYTVYVYSICGNWIITDREAPIAKDSKGNVISEPKPEVIIHHKDFK